MLGYRSNSKPSAKLPKRRDRSRLFCRIMFMFFRIDTNAFQESGRRNRGSVGRDIAKRLELAWCSRGFLSCCNIRLMHEIAACIAAAQATPGCKLYTPMARLERIYNMLSYIIKVYTKGSICRGAIRVRACPGRCVSTCMSPDKVGIMPCARFRPVWLQKPSSEYQIKCMP
jgi:hypothetical protein